MAAVEARTSAARSMLEASEAIERRVAEATVTMEAATARFEQAFQWHRLARRSIDRLGRDFADAEGAEDVVLAEEMALVAVSDLEILAGASVTEAVGVSQVA